MNDDSIPLIVEPADLEKRLTSESIMVIDLCKPEIYAQGHVPGAVHLDYGQIVATRPPVMGLVPNPAQLSTLFSAIGLTPEHHVVAYDDEGGGRACRLLWTLEIIGHRNYSLLNGGIQAWIAEQRPLTSEIRLRPASKYHVTFTASGAVSKDYVRNSLGKSGIVLVDARTPAEYRGERRLSARAGHIPGAVNFDWVNAIDQKNHLRLKPAAELRSALAAIGVTADKEVIAYCQTHHRSAHTFIVLKSLGFPRIAGYPGSWSEWGNSTDTPVE